MYEKGEGNGRMQKRRKPCQFCINNIDEMDYKDIDKLRKYVSERGRILPRRVTGNCAKHQRVVTEAIKRARHIALLPFSQD